MGQVIPEWLLTASAAATLLSVMFSLGLVLPLGDLRWIWRRPEPMLRGLFAVVIAVPVIALAVTRALDVPRLAQIGIVLMAIAPGAPVALRRSLGAGGHRAFAPSLQICAVVLSVVSMPAFIAVLNHVYAGHAAVSPWPVARQVFLAQLVPLGLGMALRQVAPSVSARLEPKLRRLGTILLYATVVLLLIDVWEVTVNAGSRVLAAIVLTTVLGLAVGHLLGGPEPAMRTAAGFSSAARNAGLALLVAALNDAPPAINATILAYVVVSALTLVPYAIWRRRAGRQIQPDT